MKTTLIVQRIAGAVRTSDLDTAWRRDAILAILEDMRPELRRRERRVLDKVIARFEGLSRYTTDESVDVG